MSCVLGLPLRIRPTWLLVQQLPWLSGMELCRLRRVFLCLLGLPYPMFHVLGMRRMPQLRGVEQLHRRRMRL